MTIEEIYYSEDLSVRSFNVCNDNGLKDLPSILSYFQENKTFDNLRNCGRKSNEELIALCLKYIDKENLAQDESTKTENPLIAKISNLTRTQREIVNSFIEINVNNLTNRSKNALSTFLNGNLKIRNLSERILTNERFNIQDIKNVGVKSTTELNSFIGLIKSFIENVSNAKDENELISMKNRFFIEKSFSISEIPSEILDSLSIFKLTDFLIECNAIFEKNQNSIFQKAFKVYRNQSELTLDEIAEELNLSRERVRQIRKSILEKLFANLQFVKNIEDDLFQKYKIDINEKYIFIEDDLTVFLNESNDTNFSKEFITYLVYVYISDKFSLLGNLDDVLLPKYFNSRERHNWECFYLIDREVDKIFQFNDFANDIDKRLNERIEETYKFNFKSYLSNFLRDDSFDLLEQVTEIAELILNNEFGIYLDLEDNIPFSRNSIKQAYEYAYEALKQLGKPAKVSEITSKILELHPDYETDDAKVRASMKRQNGFVPIGRRSVFGLKVWENELENFKGGTIRSIVLEHLERHLEPQHISTITSYVLQFRPKSNEYSILQNLKLDESGSFLFFKNSFVGLTSKNYDKSYVLVSAENTVEKKTWEERYSDLSKFLNQNDRLPFSSGCPENEFKLYRWYKIQLGKSRKGNLDSEKSILIKDVFDKYEQNSTRKRRTNVTEKYNELITFVMKQKRLPSANKEGEENLYQFFYKQRKFYDKGELRPDEEHNFIKVAKIIQTQKYEN
jgi:HD-GYP domain-containing protein (c-di-GMP phosphodiesterase class II)